MLFSPDNLWAMKAQDMNDAALFEMYRRMEDEGLVGTVFPCGCVTGPASFVTLARSPGCELRALYHIVEPVGVVWLNHPQGLACMVHFCLLRRFWVHQRGIGIWTTRAYLEPINPATGRPYLSALYGLTPAVYRHALAFIQSIGFRLLGRIPGACAFQGHEGVVFRDGIASVLTLADIHPY